MKPCLCILSQTTLPGDWNHLARLWPQDLSADYLVVFWWVAIVAVLVDGALSLLWLRQRARVRHLVPHPLRTFHKLARALGLGLRDQWLLYRVARRQALATPLTLLVSAGAFEHHVHLYLQSPAAVRRPVIARRLEELRQRLFVPTVEAPDGHENEHG